MQTTAKMRDLRSEVRDVLRVYAGIPNGIDAVDDNDDLFDAGMSSHAGVNVVLALEETFDIVFPDRMLQRCAFKSVRRIVSSIGELEAQAA
jgi:acyl carrier protein